MEVDLLFAEAKVVIEVDGPHHLADPDIAAINVCVPLRRYSNSQASGFPGFMGKSGAMVSSAWMPVISSMVLPAQAFETIEIEIGGSERCFLHLHWPFTRRLIGAPRSPAERLSSMSKLSCRETT
jgi:hypothetical protein